MHGQRRRGSVLRDFEGIAERAAHARVASRRTGDPNFCRDGQSSRRVSCCTKEFSQCEHQQ